MIKRFLFINTALQARSQPDFFCGGDRGGKYVEANFGGKYVEEGQVWAQVASM